MLREIYLDFATKAKAMAALRKMKRHYRVALRGSVPIQTATRAGRKVYRLHVSLDGTGFSSSEFASAARQFKEHMEGEGSAQNPRKRKEYDPSQIFAAAHIDPRADFHELRSEQVERLLQHAGGYRKPANASGSRGRAFFTYLQRKWERQRKRNPRRGQQEYRIYSETDGYGTTYSDWYTKADALKTARALAKEYPESSFEVYHEYSERKVWAKRARKSNPRQPGEPDERKLLAQAKRPGNNIRTMGRIQEVAHDWGLYEVSAVVSDWMRRVGATQAEMERYWPGMRKRRSGRANPRRRTRARR